MIILTAGHTGPNSGAQCATTQFDEGAENIWLRNRIAEILTNDYGLVVLMDDDRASLKLLTKALSENMSLTELTENTEDAVASPALKSVEISRATSCAARERIEEKEELKSELSVQSVGDNSNSESTRSVNQRSLSLWRKNSVHSVRNNNSERVKSVQIRRATSCAARERIEEKEELKSELSVQSVGENSNPEGTRSVNSVSSVHSVREKESSVRETTFLIDIHFNAHSNPNARGTEAIVANDATTLELRFASRLAHTTSDALDIPLRCIKSESQTPHHRLAMLHLTPQSIILEVCFCTSPEDVEAYRKNREKLAADLAWAIYELL